MLCSYSCSAPIMALGGVWSSGAGADGWRNDTVTRAGGEVNVLC
uniref:Uncharacterized protein n=1 Tax=Arundo donax TaxID=35708 RepID=A0A0A8ZQ69_ARUDO